MDKAEWELLMEEQDRKLLTKCSLPEHDELLGTLRSLIPTTGNINELFCNNFLAESVELLKHAFFLYEEGYFDCAFYSVRQSIENINNMLFSTLDSGNYKLWRDKARFPSDKMVKEQLNQKNDGYNEIKTAIPDFFCKIRRFAKASKQVYTQTGLRYILHI